ncbi:sugar transferase [Aerococcus sp.]|uniref:sugar transferase n=1 Tax=Aerococcus sp. TaxID=1872398 RepID=UPI0028B14312|nr:sugar transferase [Aerococcus sp.]
MNIYEKYIKRIIDILLSIILIILLFPIVIIIAIFIKINIGSPILFKQDRPGKNEEIFQMYKFRTMNNDKGINGELLPDSERLSNFGRILRSTSLDELPELFNILKGEMSFIGPRPLAQQYLPFYNSQERKRHLVRPGLTGLAQVNGRNTVDWETRFAFDIIYVKNISLIMDLKIVLKTIMTVLRRNDIGERGVNAPQDFDEYRKQQLEDINDFK